MGRLLLIKAGLSETEQAEHDLTVLRQQLLIITHHLYVGTRPYDGMVELITWLNNSPFHGASLPIKPAF